MLELPPPAPLLDMTELIEAVHAKRVKRHLSLRQIAEETGVSIPTVSRVLRGHVPDRENLLRLARWVGLRIDPVAERRERNRRVHGPNVGTVEAVELHLRADRRLRGEDAEALGDLFRIAYERLRIRMPEEDG